MPFTPRLLWCCWWWCFLWTAPGLLFLSLYWNAFQHIYSIVVYGHFLSPVKCRDACQLIARPWLSWPGDKTDFHLNGTMKSDMMFCSSGGTIRCCGVHDHPYKAKMVRTTEVDYIKSQPLRMIGSYPASYMWPRRKAVWPISVFLLSVAIGVMNLRQPQWQQSPHLSNSLSFVEHAINTDYRFSPSHDISLFTGLHQSRPFLCWRRWLLCTKGLLLMLQGDWFSHLPNTPALPWSCYLCSLQLICCVHLPLPCMRTYLLEQSDVSNIQ